jgi:low affinity Fe/Cu permease
MTVNRAFSDFANRTAKATGSPWAFVLCVVVVVLWAVTGPVFGFSDTWQLVINTGTTIITFLMVFLIQNTQNRDSMAIQAKLDELILTSLAENEFIGIEKLTDKELEALQARCRKAARTHQALSEQLAAAQGSRAKRGATRPDDGEPQAPRTAKAATANAATTKAATTRTRPAKPAPKTAPRRAAG